MAGGGAGTGGGAGGVSDANADDVTARRADHEKATARRDEDEKKDKEGGGTVQSRESARAVRALRSLWGTADDTLRWCWRRYTGAGAGAGAL